MTQQFVTAFNGARDYYEVPLALHEMGLLRSHINDFYCPDFLASFTRVPYKIRRRHRTGLPSCELILNYGQQLNNIFPQSRVHMIPILP